MSTTFRLVHFSPDPFTGARLPLGAVVLGADGGVHVARVEHLPGPKCVGSRELAATIRRLHGRMDSITSADELPPAFGPYTRLAEAQAVPDGVDDPVAWVRDLLNPERDPRQLPESSRGATRATTGYRFFETWHVDHYVHKTFDAGRDWGGWLRERAPALRSISHWVGGSDRVLLMEPIVPTRERFESDVRDVGERMLAYRFAVDCASNGRTAELIAYVTAGGAPQRRAEAVDHLQRCAHRVVDTDEPAARSAFVRTIRDVGASGDPQKLLHLDG